MYGTKCQKSFCLSINHKWTEDHLKHVTPDKPLDPQAAHIPDLVYMKLTLPLILVDLNQVPSHDIVIRTILSYHITPLNYYSKSYLNGSWTNH